MLGLVAGVDPRLCWEWGNRSGEGLRQLMTCKCKNLWRENFGVEICRETVGICATFWFSQCQNLLESSVEQSTGVCDEVLSDERFGGSVASTKAVGGPV